ncbi:hypothetical protein BDF20DRAFT_983951 [Mycotypha africana]|uniref:uncharacterized protein n=1 Tax=Mycotypha africana TaxID=64632 RepID=UPI0023000185|nr:uncharacterized protein BDF20DRAFT_983951 [Mycotypha africana]KAI8991258.1 hypothetical protein BDF20DRAFT_983951 [Mycotypha africana]
MTVDLISLFSSGKIGISILCRVCMNLSVTMSRNQSKLEPIPPELHTVLNSKTRDCMNKLMQLYFCDCILTIHIYNFRFLIFKKRISGTKQHNKKGFHIPLEPEGSRGPLLYFEEDYEI